MTQIVFVHGVATRRDGDYQATVDARDRRFLELAFKGAAAKIVNPYWGQFGTATGDLRCIPRMAGEVVSLGLGSAGLAGPAGLAGAGTASTMLLDAARVDLAAVVGALSVTAIDQAEASQSPEKIAAAERVWTGAAAVAASKPAWLDTVADDTAFLERLKIEAEALAPSGAPVSLGLFDGFRQAGEKLAGDLSNLVNGPIAKAGREVLTPKIAVFIGDVFKYLKGEASGRADIRRVLITDLAAAAQRAGASGEKLVLIGHSMGGVILFDLLSDPAALDELEQASGRPFVADLLVTVGSQVALFAEMHLYTSSDRTAALPLKRPPGARMWWNVYDKMDLLSFLCAPVFEEVTDFSVDTTAGIADAHGAYFSSMMFYSRLNARLKEAGLL